MRHQGSNEALMFPRQGFDIYGYTILFWYNFVKYHIKKSIYLIN